MAMYLRANLTFEKPVKLVHFAPEVQIASVLSGNRNVDYLSVDLDPGRAMQQEDITTLSFADGSIGAIVCIHVLEHVPDDRKAMRELHRVLAEDGFAILDVPIDYSREETYEDSAIVTPEQRTKAYWQWDHVRLYGRDFPQRLEEAGFKVKVEEFVSSLDDDVISYHGLERNPIYLCTH